MNAEITPNVSTPLHVDLDDLAASLGMHLSADEKSGYETLGPLLAAALAAVTSMEVKPSPPKYPRKAWWTPTAAENRLNAWYVRTEIRGATRGVLRGRTVALKDNILLADTPLMNGSPTLKGYIADFDATVATRVLDAGAMIAGKAHCEPLCLGGGSHLNRCGPIHNPHRLGFSAGGSSSGVAALVGAGEVDLAIGADQGGSIRMPSSFCGVVGIKPTFGLIPYTGAIPLEVSLDHLGPITRSVADNALLLSVLAGPDGLDPRQSHASAFVCPSLDSIDLRGVRLAALKEGFELENLDPRVATTVRNAISTLERLGATVSNVSVPQHPYGNAISFVLILTAFVSMGMDGDGLRVGKNDSSLLSFAAFHRQWRNQTDALSPFARFLLLWGKALLTQRGMLPYAFAQRAVPALRASYDRALQDCDALAMPTLPIVAQPHPPVGASTLTIMERAIEMRGNTQQFNATGHPAITIPCGLVDGLPVGIQLVGKHFSEGTLYKIGAALEGAKA